MEQQPHRRLMQASNLVVGYGGPPVINNTNFVIDDHPGGGEIEVIIAPSGRGKTTLMKALAGLMPFQGELTISDGVAPLRPRRVGDVGFVFQNSRVFEHLTVQGNLLLAAHQGAHPHNGHTGLVFTIRRIVDWHKMRSEYLAKIEEQLDAFRLREHVNKYPYELSGGQRQRLAIFMQLLTSAQFIVYDEPFSGQDPLMKLKTCKTLINMAKLSEVRAWIIITHDLEFGAWAGRNIHPVGFERDQAGNPLSTATMYPAINMEEKGFFGADESILRAPHFMEFVKWMQFDLMPTL
jgi:ABC-type nitrate/sulfonate/bicarbonate transport system ATPase subunit